MSYILFPSNSTLNFEKVHCYALNISKRLEVIFLEDMSISSTL